MAKYISQYKQLAFYVEGERKQFANGVFVTEDKPAIAVLDAMHDVVRIDEPAKEPAPKAESKAEAPTKPTKAKASAKK
ncbi:hypothetical protein [Sporosarcina koreensis]|uniref:hypothetical protein n=1 Tax=Sporosarcina koreensis TaxID=334735 RepID=UPI000751DDFE|nr:hypothetical protein [Sporosarcina koreensis]